MKRVKRLRPEQYGIIAAHSWTPVKLEGTCIPECFSRIPKGVVHSIYASGTCPGGGIDYSDQCIGTAQLIGAIEIYRYAPDDPVELNKDRYAVVITPGDTADYIISGPMRDSEHWLDEIPERYIGAVVYGAHKSR